MRLVSALLMATVLLWSTTSSALVLCARPRADGTYNSSIKVRNTCKGSETQLDPVALGLQGPPGPGGGAHLKDTNGLDIGHLMGPDQVTVSVGGVDTLAFVDRDGFTPIGTLYFTSLDCTGQGLVHSSLNGVLPICWSDGTTAWVVPRSGASLTTNNSERRLSREFVSQAGCDTFFGAGNSTFTAPNGCCLSQLSTQELASPASTGALPSVVPPFSVALP
jgi:hypothetical protein